MTKPLFALQRRFKPRGGEPYWGTLRDSLGPLHYLTADEAVASLRFWNDGSAVREDFRVTDAATGEVVA